MKITKDMVGKKVKLNDGVLNDVWIKILYIGDTKFFGVNSNDLEYGFDVNRDWELVEEKKLYAPALVKTDAGHSWITNTLYQNLKDSQKEYKHSTVIWPAPLPNKDGYYEL